MLQKCHNFPASFVTFFAMATSKKPNLTYGSNSIAQDCMQVLRPFLQNGMRAMVTKVFGQCKSGDKSNNSANRVSDSNLFI